MLQLVGPLSAISKSYSAEAMANSKAQNPYLFQDQGLAHFRMLLLLFLRLAALLRQFLRGTLLLAAVAARSLQTRVLYQDRSRTNRSFLALHLEVPVCFHRVG